MVKGFSQQCLVLTIFQDSGVLGLEVIDVISLCSGISAQELINLLKPLQPRYYSVSSSAIVVSVCNVHFMKIVS